MNDKEVVENGEVWKVVKKLSLRMRKTKVLKRLYRDGNLYMIAILNDLQKSSSKLS